MESQKNKVNRVVIGFALAAGIIGAGAVPASAAKAPAPTEHETHCVVEVTGVDRDGVFFTTPEICFGTEAEADAAAASKNSRSSNGTIGKHYSSQNYGGSSITISGTTCGGGVWYPTGSWDNNIESSRHYCGSAQTKFYDSSNCSSGAYPITSNTTSLGWANNKASCVRYG